MDIREMRTLLHVAGNSSLRETAAELNLSPAAVHKQMKTLEREIGLPLYTRQGMRLRLTRVALTLLPYAQALVAQQQAALAAVDEMKGLRRGVVRIGAGPTIATYLVPRLMRRFRATCPGIDVQVETGNSATLLEWLDRGSIDLAFLVSVASGEDPLHRAHLVWDFEMMAVSRTSPSRTRVALAQLARTPMILFKKGSRMEAGIDSWFAARAFQPRVSMRLDNADSIKAMVRAGFGMSFLPYWTVAGDLRSGALKEVRIGEPPMRGNIVLLSHAQLYLSEATQAFLKTTKATRVEELHLAPRRTASRSRTRTTRT